MITQSDSASNALRIDTLLRIPPLSSRTGFCHTSVSATALYASSSSLSDIVLKYNQLFLCIPVLYWKQRSDFHTDDPPEILH